MSDKYVFIISNHPRWKRRLGAVIKAHLFLLMFILFQIFSPLLVREIIPYINQSMVQKSGLGPLLYNTKLIITYDHKIFYRVYFNKEYKYRLLKATRLVFEHRHIRKTFGSSGRMDRLNWNNFWGSKLETNIICKACKKWNTIFINFTFCNGWCFLYIHLSFFFTHVIILLEAQKPGIKTKLHLITIYFIVLCFQNALKWYKSSITKGNKSISRHIWVLKSFMCTDKPWLKWIKMLKSTCPSVNPSLVRMLDRWWKKLVTIFQVSNWQFYRKNIVPTLF